MEAKEKPLLEITQAYKHRRLSASESTQGAARPAPRPDSLRHIYTGALQRLRQGIDFC